MCSIDREPPSRYKRVTLMGNWVEDRYLEIEKLKAFKLTRDHGNLMVEKTRHLFENFHKEVELSAPKQNIHFGAIVQFVPMQMKICENTGFTPTLAVVINERVVRYSERLNTECELTIAPSLGPCVRNSFRIVSADDKDRTNEVLKYGQAFRIQVLDTDPDVLLVYSAPKCESLGHVVVSTFDSRKFGEINVPLGLCSATCIGAGRDTPSAFANWHCRHIHPVKRFQTHYTPLESNSPLVITHFATNKNLAAENLACSTLFGPEYLVSVQDYRDSFKRESWKNTWMISNGQTTYANKG